MIEENDILLKTMYYMSDQHRAGNYHSEEHDVFKVLFAYSDTELLRLGYSWKEIYEMTGDM